MSDGDINALANKSFAYPVQIHKGRTLITVKITKENHEEFGSGTLSMAWEGIEKERNNFSEHDVGEQVELLTLQSTIEMTLEERNWQHDPNAGWEFLLDED